MMKSKFDDVIEYVKAGENDPEVEKMLHLHPDGQELLKQARFICKMLQRQSESTDNGDIAASFNKIVGSVEGVADLRSMEYLGAKRPRRTFYQEAPLSIRASQSLSISRKIKGGERDVEDLGTLELAMEGKQVALSYDPSEAVVRRTRNIKSPRVATAQTDFEGILIHGRSLTLSVPETLASDEPVTIRVNQYIGNLPAKHLELIYMPDSGPFVRVETDDEGCAKLPMPEQSGTLRIESGIPHLLHIKLK